MIGYIKKKLEVIKDFVKKHLPSRKQVIVGVSLLVSGIVIGVAGVKYQNKLRIWKLVRPATIEQAKAFHKRATDIFMAVDAEIDMKGLVIYDLDTQLYSSLSLPENGYGALIDLNVTNVKKKAVTHKLLKGGY